VNLVLARKLDAALGVTPGVSWKPAMDLHKIISELQSEKQRLDEAIQALERLSSVSSKGNKKRGRPPIQKPTADSEHSQSKAQGQ
jgi:hypothetical protein